MCGRPLQCKGYFQRDKHRSGASMCSTCSRSTAWLLALMNSADHIPNRVTSSRSKRSAPLGLCDPRSDRSVITAELPSTPPRRCSACGEDGDHAAAAT